MPSQPRGIDAVGDLVVVACINDVRKYFWGFIITARKRSSGQGNIFTPVCHSVHRGGEGVCGCSGGGCVVALGGACMVAPGEGHAWLLWGGVHGCSRGACMVALGGHAWLLGGACMVVWGASVVAPGGACVVARGGVGYDEIRRYDQ